MSEQMLKAYIERVAILQRDRVLKPEEMREIARDLGMSEADLAEAEAAGAAHLERGKGYLAHGRCEDAVRELEEAIILLPGALEPMWLLARAHRECWLRTSEASNREAAQRLARQCIELDSGMTEAYELLNELEGRCRCRCVVNGRGSDLRHPRRGGPTGRRGGDAGPGCGEPRR